MKIFIILILFTVSKLFALDLSEPARYAFISDAESNKLAVFDSYENKIVTYIPLTVVPGLLTVSRTNHLLIYGMKGSTVLYIIDLETGKQRIISAPLPINQILFNPTGDLLAIAARGSVFLSDIKSKDFSATEIKGFNFPVNIMYNNGGEYLLISEKTQGRVTSYNIKSKQKREIFKINSSLTNMYLTPDSKYLLVGDIYKYNLHISSVFDDKTNKIIPLNGIPEQPYVSNDGNTILIATENKHLYKINNRTNNLETKRKMNDFIYSVKTGWLDSTEIIIYSSSISLTDSRKKSKPTIIDVDGYITNSIITSDTKTLLAIEQYKSELFVIDIRNRKIKKKLQLDLAEPNLITMGLTDTIYH